MKEIHARARASVDPHGAATDNTPDAKPLAVVFIDIIAELGDIIDLSEWDIDHEETEVYTDRHGKVTVELFGYAK